MYYYTLYKVTNLKHKNLKFAINVALYYHVFSILLLVN